MTLRIVQDETADELLSTNAFALLCGMLLQQQVSIEVAFSGPAKILQRLGSLDPASVEAAAAEDFAKLCATEPAIHPYPESMSVLIQAVARFIVANYAGDTASLWETAGSGEHLLSRLMLLPGFSRRQAQMFIALLGKQLGVRPPGWENAAGPFAQPDVHRSVADVRDAMSLEKVQTAKSRRSKGHGDANGHDNSTTSRTTKSSKGSGHVTTEEEQADQPETAEEAERTAARKARKAAKRAAIRAAKQENAGDDAVAEPGERGAGGGGGGGGGGGKRAAAKAKKAAKRAARRAARGEDPDAPAKKGGGRTAEGRRGQREGGGRRGRDQADGAAADEEPTSEATTDEVSPEIASDPVATSEGDSGGLYS